VTTLLYLAPIIVVIGLVGSGRVSLIKAGFGRLIATLPVVAVAMDGRADYTAFVLTESLKGAWLAWHNVAVIFAGLLLHHVIRTAAPKAGDTRQPDATMRHRQAYFLCFVTAGVVECAIGFGVGFGIAIYGLLRLGAPVHAAVALGLISQMLVPWGALSIGTVIGAALGHLPLDPFGYTSALLMPAFGLGLLSWFWWWSHSLSFGLTVKNAVLDLLWTAALLGLLYLGNRYVSVDTAGLVATAPLLALGYLLDRQRLAIPRMLRIAAPFVLLVGVLLSTRLVAPLGEALRAYLVTHPFGDLPPFPWLYHAASMLLLTAGIYGAVMLRPAQWRSAIAATWRGGRVAMATTLIFLVMARLFSAAGIPAELAAAWQSVAGDHALLATPIFAAVAGGLTGGNTASNSLLLPLQAALAQSAGASVLWVGALQNVTGSMFTPFAPGKVALACAFAGWAGGERQAYRAILPLGFILLPIALLIAALL